MDVLDALGNLPGPRKHRSLFLSFWCITAVATYLYARKRPEGDAALLCQLYRAGTSAQV